MTDMQTSLPLLIVRPSILNPVINFSTHLWPVKWNGLRLYLCLAHSIPLLSFIFFSFSFSCRCNTCTQQVTNDMIHFISSHDLIGTSILTSLALHRCLGPSAPSIAQASSPRGPSLQSLDLPFSIVTGPWSQALSWSSPPWSHDSMSWLICNELLLMWTNPCVYLHTTY